MSGTVLVMWIISFNPHNNSCNNKVGTAINLLLQIRKFRLRKLNNLLKVTHIVKSDFRARILSNSATLNITFNSVIQNSRDTYYS